MAYEEYPRMLYKANSEPTIVNDDDQKDAALADGFSLLPAGDAPPLPGQAPPPEAEANDESKRAKKKAAK